ncbi:MAG TPA: carbohydrate kinase family protein, partial [Clostridia bacterium]|nr:carbohydrate kinase family protein [Clostridia bacterium]
LRLKALGRIGSDALGDFILDNLMRFPNINLDGVIKEGMTSFTAVMADEKTKTRTFYQYRGANAHFNQTDIDWQELDVSFLHIGYILLLDALDEPDDVYGTKMAGLLHQAQTHGIKTSIDVVTEAGDRFTRIVPPALKYTDYCVINEIEAQAVTGVPLRDANDELLKQNMPAALARLKEMGVSTWSCIHSVEGGFGLDENNTYCELESLRLPPGYIAGTVGAGDAFCSGIIYAAWQKKSLYEALELGTAAAACSLSEVDATAGLRSADEVMKLYRRLR